MAHNQYTLHGHTLKRFSADSGVTSQFMFRVTTPAVTAYRQAESVFEAVSDPYNHAIGTPIAERVIQTLENRYSNSRRPTSTYYKSEYSTLGFYYLTTTSVMGRDIPLGHPRGEPQNMPAC
jgi:hypothetical protein